jgi:hypothetical protein
MATKAPVKKVRVTAKDVKAHREKSTRDYSPKWDGAADWTGERFTAHFRDAMKWYNLESNGKALKPQVINWMARSGYTRAQIAEFKKTKDSRCGTTMGAIAACLMKGMPAVHPGFNNGKDTSQWLGAEIAKVIEAGKHDIDEEAVADAKAAEPVIQGPTIQERVRDAAWAMTEELEDAVEKFQTDPEAFDPKEFKVVNLLRGKGVKAAHARIIRDFYAKQHSELEELLSAKPDAQLIEGYKHRTKKQIKAIYAFYTEILNACTMLMEEAKVLRKPRTPKAVSKDKVVAKLKFKKQDEPLKLVSVNPVDIIGAKELWTYNTKTRKLGKYVAAEYQELGVKGTTIVNFDESKSIQKTLRKPAEQLKEFKAAGKVALRKFLDDINAVDTKMNGRISEDVILLKVAS